MKTTFLAIAGVLFAATLALVFLSGSSTADAQAPWVDRALGAASARVNYSVGSAHALVARDRAIAEARTAGRGNPDGLVRSARLALFQDPFAGSRLVWVVDIAGLNIPAFGGTVAQPGPAITRAVFIVSASDPDQVIAFYSIDSD